MSATESAISSPDWQLAEKGGEKPSALVVQLRRGAFIFPWFRFVYAEGDNAAVEAVFSSHAIRVTGQGLAALLVGLSGQTVVRVIEPSDNEAGFAVRGQDARDHHSPAIHSITVTKFE